MNRDLLIILILLILNLIVALVYLLVHLRKQDRKKGIVNFITFLAFPIVGFVYMGIAELANVIILQKRQKELRYDELSFSKERMKLMQDPDVDKSLNYVALEEALLMSNKLDRRQSLMEVLKQDDYGDMISNIKDAVTDDDKEVSHYAATFVSETSARFKARESELRKQVEKNSSNENLITYIEYVRDMIDSGIFSGMEQKRYIYMLDHSAWALYERDPELLLDSMVTSLVVYFRNLGDQEKTESWMDVVRVRSLESLECFKAFAAHCYAVQDKEGFFSLLESVKHSRIALDSEALEWIRYFA